MGGDRASIAKLPIKNQSDVDGCTAPDCIWFDFRMGKDPIPNENKVAAGRKRGFPKASKADEGARIDEHISVCVIT